MKFLVEKTTRRFFVKGDDGQTVELTNLVSWKTSYDAVGPFGGGPIIDMHLEFRGIDVDYIDAVVKKSGVTNIRTRKMR